MKRRKYIRPDFLAKLLMAASLLLLACFLTLFLYNTYQEEKQNLNKEVGLLFVSAVRSIEGGLLNQLILNKQEKPDSVTWQVITNDLPLDGGPHTIAFFNEETEHVVKRDSQRIEINVRNTQSGPSNLQGAISMVIDLNADDTLSHPDLPAKEGRTKLFVRKLTHNFEEAIQQASLPIDYRIVSDSVSGWHQDSSGLMTSGSYTDIASGKQFFAQVTQYQGWILRKMIPQIVFSLVLFTCITLAFWLVYKNLATEKRLMGLKNDFIQNISHELKTPIATVSVALEALRDFEAIHDPLRTEEYLQISQNELQRLSLLVNKVLAIAQLESTEPPLDKTVFDLRELITEVSTSLQLPLEKTRAQLSIETTGTDFSLLADRFHLSGLLFNLLDNAIKYSLPAPPHICIQLSAEPEGLQLSVADQGPGIAEEHRNRIFEKFYRIPSGEVHNVKGHGLGLSYAARVAQQHQGSIRVEPGQPQGAVFRVWLPRG